MRSGDWRPIAALVSCLLLSCSSGYITSDGLLGSDAGPVVFDAPSADAPIWVAADAGTDGTSVVDVAFRPVEDQTTVGPDAGGDLAQGPDGVTPEPDLGGLPDAVSGPDRPDQTGPLSCPDPGEPDDSCPGQLLAFGEGESRTMSDRVLAPAGDADTVTLRFQEASHLCFPGDGQSFAAYVEIVPAAGSDLEVGYNLDACNDSWSPAGQLAFCFTWGGVCGGNDDVDLHLQLTSTRAASCEPYQMRVTFCNEGEACGGC